MSKKSSDNISMKLVFACLLALTVKKLFDFATFLTKYFPFSVLVPEDRVFHYKNKKGLDIQNSIRNVLDYASPIYEKDEYFFRLYYNKKDITRKEIEEKLKGKEVFISETEGLIKISIPRD